MFLRLHYRCADVADCFHRMRLSGEIRHFFLLARGTEQVRQRDCGNQNFAPPDSLVDVLFVADGFFLEPASTSLSLQTEHD